jgi:hypothetical protein
MEGMITMDQMELFPLSPNEVRDRAKTMAATMQRYDALEAESKRVAKRYKDDLKELRVELSHLSEVVTHEEEWRAHVPPWQQGGPDEDR